MLMVTDAKCDLKIFLHFCKGKLDARFHRDFCCCGVRSSKFPRNQTKRLDAHVLLKEKMCFEGWNRFWSCIMYISTSKNQNKTKKINISQNINRKLQGILLNCWKSESTQKKLQDIIWLPYAMTHLANLLANAFQTKMTPWGLPWTLWLNQLDLHWCMLRITAGKPNAEGYDGMKIGFCWWEVSGFRGTGLRKQHVCNYMWKLGTRSCNCNSPLSSQLLSAGRNLEVLQFLDPTRERRHCIAWWEMMMFSNAKFVSAKCSGFLKQEQQWCQITFVMCLSLHIDSFIFLLGFEGT